MRFPNRNNRKNPHQGKDYKDLLARSVSVGTTEYTQIFGALRDRLNYFAQFFQFYFAGLLVIYGAAITSRSYELIFIMPILALPPFWKLVWDQLMVKKMGKYISNHLTDRIHCIVLAGETEKYTDVPMTWEKGWGPYADGPKYHKHALIGLFIIDTCIPPFFLGIYNALAINETIVAPAISSLYAANIEWAALFNCAGALMSAAVGLYIYLVIRNNEF